MEEGMISLLSVSDRSFKMRTEKWSLDLLAGVKTSHIFRLWSDVKREWGECGIGDNENRQLYKGVATERHR